MEKVLHGFVIMRDQYVLNFLPVDPTYLACGMFCRKRCRVQMIRVNTLFKYVCYHPANHQIITTGTDRKIGYFETYDGSMIRELEGSMSGAINAMDISDCGNFVVSGGDDKLVKVSQFVQ